MIKFMLTIILILVFLVGSFEWSSRVVYGRYLSSAEANEYFDRHLNDYKLNDTAWPERKMLTGFPNDLPFIAMSVGISGTTYINGYGRIRNYSSAGKRLRAYFDSLPKPKQPTLSDL